MLRLKKGNVWTGGRGREASGEEQATATGTALRRGWGEGWERGGVLRLSNVFKGLIELIASLCWRRLAGGASALLASRAAVARRRRRPPGPPGECARSTDARARCHELPTVCDGRPRLRVECGAEAPPQGLPPRSCPQAHPEADALRPLLRRVLMT